MQFIYYSDRTVSQCMMALNERIHAKNGKLDGWTEKNGNFALEFTSSVMRQFSRTTRLQAKAERENNFTVIKGHVSEGIDPRRRTILYGLLMLAGVFIVLQGNVIPGLIAMLAPFLLNIPLEGDHKNSQVLLGEVQRTLKAKHTPPAAPAKRTSEPRRTTLPRRATIARKPSVTRRSTTARKPSSQRAKAHR